MTSTTTRLMPKKKNEKKRKHKSSSDDSEDEESEYEVESDVSLQADDDDDDDVIDDAAEDDAADNDLADEAMKPTARKKYKPATSMKRSKATYTASRPLYDKNGNRLTERGGYAHDIESKMKISKANRGKTPWNKNKERSGTDKAKISAGVKARNRSILLQQLKDWNMTEHEYLALRRKTKTVRERLRRTKVANSQLKTDSEQKTVKFEPDSACESSDNDNDAGEKQDEIHEQEFDATAPDESAIEHDGADSRQDNFDMQQQQQQQQQDTSSVSRMGDYSWDPHPFDTDDPSVYAQACPVDGPGGLICCSVCTANYSRYMSITYSNLEQQTMSIIGRDAKELGSLLQKANHTLERTLPGTATVKPKRGKRRK
ncbi:hypothetical protein MPSEU_000578300 [Mayamaea pseudoterrestris]|nr:hypothetical protein MPSEU_000578300 [Mayamaea pseudoterrestris]